jgi:hypothetical protein
MNGTKQQSRIGPWILGRSLPPARLEGLVKELNRTLIGKQLLVVSYDTVEDTMTPGYMSLRSEVEIMPYGGAPAFISIPVNLGIEVSIKPLVFEGKAYPASIDILGDHVTIRVHYLFHSPARRVDTKLYNLTAISSLA